LSPLLQALMTAVGDPGALQAQRVVLHVGQVIYEPGQLRHEVYFPEGAMISLVFALRRGHSCEICHIGRHGMLGLQSLMGEQETGYSAIVQQGGLAWRLPAQWLQALLDTHASVRQLLLQHLQATITQLAQLAVCHRHHQLDGQLARLLMQFVDDNGNPRLMLTHERIAQLLGVRRAGVTASLGQLVRQGLVQGRRGCIEVRQPERLQALACDCLERIRQAQRWLTAPVSA